jgi:hypothetical protein
MTVSVESIQPCAGEAFPINESARPNTPPPFGLRSLCFSFLLVSLAASYLLCLPPSCLPRPAPPPLSARDRVGAVALAARLLHGTSMLGSKGLALIAAAAAGERHDVSDPLEPDLVDGVQATLQVIPICCVVHASGLLFHGRLGKTECTGGGEVH